MADIFMVRATRCTRCGGILLSEYGLKHGMGNVCKRKHDLENAPPDPNQVTLFDSGNRGSVPLDEIELSVHALCSLMRAGYKWLCELYDLTDDELKEAVGYSARDFETLKRLLKEG